MKTQWFRKKWVIVLIHVSVWVLLFSLPYLLHPSNNPDVDRSHPEPGNTWANFLVARASDLLLVSAFYLNSLWLIPKFFYKKRYLLYLLLILVCYAVFALASGFLSAHFQHMGSPFSAQRHILFTCFTFLFILACSIAYKTIKDKIDSDNRAKEKEHENLKTELSLLRMQVSPHFMFNVLNNMVGLARKKSDILEPSLIKLSSLMRYMLYETGEEKVSLEKETEYLQSYIDLQMQRFGKNLSLHEDMPAPDRSYDIEPMLLIPFVENAFKHGTGTEKSALDINLKAEAGVLSFTVSNGYDPLKEEIKDKTGGIGLVNVQRRLELLYPEKHELLIRKNHDTFTVSLQITLI